MEHAADGPGAGASGGQGFEHVDGHHHDFNHDYVAGHGAHTMRPCFLGATPQEQYGEHAVVLVRDMGVAGNALMDGDGHVLSLASDMGQHMPGTSGHTDGKGGGNKRPQDLCLRDVNNANLLVAHVRGLKDRGPGYYGKYFLDAIAEDKARPHSRAKKTWLEALRQGFAQFMAEDKTVGLKLISDRPGYKGEDHSNLDGILPWDAFSDLGSSEGPDGYLPGLRGKTDRYIHVFAIPTWVREEGVLTPVVSPYTGVTLSVRMTVWHYYHYSGLNDVEIKIEVIVNSNYVYNSRKKKYTVYKTATRAIRVKALKLIKALYAWLTNPSERADPRARRAYIEYLKRQPGVMSPGKHAEGIRRGTPEEEAAIAAEAINKVKTEDRDTENQVVSGSGLPAAPAGGGFDDDGTTAVEPLGGGGAVVAGPPALPGPVDLPADKAAFLPGDKRVIGDTPLPAMADRSSAANTRANFIIPASLFADL